jgi:hypothetical protein
MWNAYVAASALLYATLAVMHLVRIISGWSVVIGPNRISMSVSWLALVVSGLLSIWGFAQLA